MTKKRSIDGFQLIELLVVLAMIGILTCITLPTYQHYLAQAHRNTAKSHLLHIAAKMEKYGIEHNSYQKVSLAQLGDFDNRYYEYTISSVTDNSYLLIAIPMAQQAENDLRCGTLTLNSFGEKNITGNGDKDDCW